MTGWRKWVIVRQPLLNNPLLDKIKNIMRQPRREEIPMQVKDFVTNYRIFNKNTMGDPTKEELKSVCDALEFIGARSEEYTAEFLDELREMGEINVDEFEPLVAEAVLEKYVDKLEMLLEVAMQKTPDYLYGYVEMIGDC